MPGKWGVKNTGCVYKKFWQGENLFDGFVKPYNLFNEKFIINTNYKILNVFNKNQNNWISEINI